MSKYQDTGTSSLFTNAVLSREMVDLEAIDREMAALEREYRLSFAVAALLGCMVFGSLLASF